jgi:hypothetical protein
MTDAPFLGDGVVATGAKLASGVLTLKYGRPCGVIPKPRVFTSGARDDAFQKTDADSKLYGS